MGRIQPHKGPELLIRATAELLSHSPHLRPKLRVYIVGGASGANTSEVERLKELATKGISPSALTNYLYNPISFYKQKILKLKEFEVVEETIAYNTLGTVVHETLDELYTPFIGKFLLIDSIAQMERKVKKLVVKHFRNEFKNGDITTGKNRLIFEVAVFTLLNAVFAASL